LGYEFGTFTDRFHRLEEALAIIEPMLRGRRPTVEGRWYRTENAMNEPRVRDDLPIMLGGAGERKTFRYAAQYAAHLNMICDDVAIPAKLEALAQRCEEVGRDRSTLETSHLAFMFLGESDAEAEAMYHEYAAVRGVDLDAMDAATRATFGGRHVVGGPDSVAEQVQRRILDPGVDGVIVNMVANGHVPGMVELAGKTLGPLVHP
jgi:alkanesulfonate monooxygenase SsuD/methylene tetrahydromethanopterin reductase-like flavin-dependent oxidoreductase (luciferase family)